MRLNISVYPFGIGRRRRRSDGMLWKIIGGAAVAIAVAGVVRRYLRLS